jgi:hypothetical protein
MHHIFKWKLFHVMSHSSRGENTTRPPPGRIPPCWGFGFRGGGRGGRCVGDGQTLPRDESLIARREHHATSVEFLLVRDLDFREAGGVSETARAPAFEVRA